MSVGTVLKETVSTLSLKDVLITHNIVQRCEDEESEGSALNHHSLRDPTCGFAVSRACFLYIQSANGSPSQRVSGRFPRARAGRGIYSFCRHPIDWNSIL